MHVSIRRRAESKLKFGTMIAIFVRIRDDGKGINPRVLREGGSSEQRALHGVRERAQQIGARLDFGSEAGADTEVELTVPSAVAYQQAKERRRSSCSEKCKLMGTAQN